MAWMLGHSEEDAMRIDNPSSSYPFAPQGLQWKLAVFCLAGILLVLANPTAFGQGHQVVPITVPGANAGSTTPFGVNKSHYVVGWSQGSSGHTLGFLYEAGKYTNLTPPGASGTEVTAYGINDSNVVVGDFFGTDNYYHGYTYTAGTYKQYDVDLGVVSTSLFGINSLGHLAGSWLPRNTLVEEGFIDVGGDRKSTRLNSS